MLMEYWMKITFDKSLQEENRDVDNRQFAL